jgi:predicted Zn-dependent peptidase
MEGQEAGYFGSYIACAPSKKSKAIQMMKDEFEKLVNEPVLAKELESAKASLIGRAEIALQRNSEISEKILFDAVYGQPYDSYLSYPEAIRSVTSQDIITLMEELYAEPSVLVVLG